MKSNNPNKNEKEEKGTILVNPFAKRAKSTSPAKSGEKESMSRGRGVASLFPKEGRSRSPPRDRLALSDTANGGALPKLGVKALAGASGSKATEETMNGPALARAMLGIKSGMPGLEKATAQLDLIVEFLKGRNNISKELKQSCLMLRKSLLDAKKERDDSDKSQGKANSSKLESKVSQTEPYVVVGSETLKPMEVDVGKATQSLKRARRQSDDSTPDEGTHKRAMLTNNNGVVIDKPAERAANKRSKDPPKPKGAKPPGAKPKGEMNNKGEAPRGQGWTQVVNRKVKRKAKQAKRPNTVTKTKGDAIIVKADQATYAQVLTAIKASQELADLRQDIASTRKIRSGETIIRLKKEAKGKSAEYSRIAKEVIGESAEFRAVGDMVNVQGKNLDEVATAEELAAALLERRNVVLDPKSISMRRGPYGTQVATFKVPAAEAKKLVANNRLQVSLSVCHLSIYQPALVCYRCFGHGHKAFECKGPDRAKLCRRCGKEGHKARDCKDAPKCMICSDEGRNDHATGGYRCPSSKGADRKKQWRN